MSTYIRPEDKKLPKYDDICQELEGYLKYLIVVCGRSLKTANMYYVNLRGYLRYLIMKSDNLPEEKYDEIQIKNIDPELIRNASRELISDYIFFTAARGNSVKTRKDKLTALRSFYDFLVTEKSYPENPALYIKLPKLPKREPKYLNLADAQQLLFASAEQENPERDYCITILFLTTGLRLSELCSLNVDSFDRTCDTFTIVGKGDKERTGYLNTTSKTAIDEWLDIRAGYTLDRDEKALFVSKRTKKRLTGRAVEKIIEKELDTAGLAGKGYSAHKLRHSAATFMYSNGAGLMELKEILGHSHTTTTEIYTHLNQERLHDVSKSIDGLF